MKLSFKSRTGLLSCHGLVSASWISGHLTFTSQSSADADALDADASDQLWTHKHPSPSVVHLPCKGILINWAL